VERVGGDSHPSEAEILTAEASSFLDDLHKNFAATRDQLLYARRHRYAKVVSEGRLDFLPDTEHIRNGVWSVADCPPALQDRRVEITGPATPAKMAINALNSGAKVWLADLEDACTPTWWNLIDSQCSLSDATKRQLHYSSPEGKQYNVDNYDTSPVIVMRPRGWHMNEAHLRYGGREAIGALVDFGLFVFHNGAQLADVGRGPFFYLPKMESHLEARLWADVFAYSEEVLGIPRGTIRATVLIETIPAAFEMDEILYELREYASGLNAGRWDYLFSLVKYFRELGHDFVLPDRAQVTMTQPFMRAYTNLLVKTCHARGAHAIGGMAAAIPNRKRPDITEQAFDRVRADKEREAGDGFDGSWVAHPDLVEICRKAFTDVLGDSPNQVSRQRDDVTVTGEELLDIASADGSVTSEGLKSNVYVALMYMAAWLSGSGAAAIRNLMEDVATAEISMSQLWQLVRYGIELADTGEKVTPDYLARIIREEAFAIAADVGTDSWGPHFDVAQRLLEELVLSDDYVDFLTDLTYRELDGVPAAGAAT
jgi:malate synthase